MRVGIAQIDSRIGDFSGNVRRIVRAAEIASAAGAELCVLPELVVTGSPPRDLLFDPRFVARATLAADEIAARTADLIPVLVGSIAPSGRTLPGHPGLFDAALLLAGGAVRQVIAKRLLPSYDVFHEPRWFLPGPPSEALEIAGRRVGVVICEDLWDEGYPQSPGAELEAAGAELLVCLSASPFRPGALSERERHAHRRGVPVVYVNACGANDELVFDGGSFVAKGGALVARLPRFSEAVEVIDTEAAPVADGRADGIEEVRQALVLGVRGFAQKHGLRQAYLGLSGGIDSSLVACLAKDALGAERVTALAMPSRHTDPRSTECATALCEALGVRLVVHPIEPLHGALESDLAGVIGERDSRVAENLQARLRAMILMAHVNQSGGLLLNTSNKTELALGYGTLYGDMAGTLCVIGDVTKPDVYRLARHYQGVIPPFVFDRPPSAELRPAQVDPFDYDRVSPEVESLVVGAGHDDRLEAAIRAAEHKRWQAGIVLKVSDKAFGTGRMIPVTRV